MTTETTTYDGAWATRWILNCADAVDEHKQELTNLDREIGDADHGENMARGFDAVRSRLNDADGEQSISDVLGLVARTLISTVGGASGPLYGTAFLKAAKAVKPFDTLDGQGALKLVAAFEDGIVTRGKANPGDKTMVDAIDAAREDATQAVDDGPAAVLAAAARGARVGAEATIPMVAHKGRASYLGERAVGHQDPGATSTALIWEAAVAA